MAAIAHRKRAGKKTRAERPKTSNVFKMFEQSQIHEFKEVFTMIDTNKDGFITPEDLREIYGNLGKEVSQNRLYRLSTDYSSQHHRIVYICSVSFFK